MSDQEEHREKTKAFFDGEKPKLKGNLSEAVYTMSEMGLWEDSVDSVCEEQALLCWAIVEKLRVEKFPDELRM